MTNEAIGHVQEAENTVAQIRNNTKTKIEAIESKKQEEFDRLEEELEAEIQLFKRNERQKFEENLENKVQTSKEEVQNRAKEYEAAYAEKQNEISDYIVKEVLGRYGN